MKKTLFTLLSLLCTLTGFAQFDGNGYYRVTNSNDGYYAWMVDCTGGRVGNEVDTHALKLWSASKYDPTCEPQTVIYVKEIDSANNTYDLEAQGTSLYKIIAHYLTIKGNATTNKYLVYASQSGFTFYLYEGDKSYFEYYAMVAKQSGDNNLRFWSANPISAESTTNYFGVKPTITVNGKHYAPFYACFPFKFYSKGMKAYYVSQVIEDGKNIAILKEVTSDIIPGATPLLIECSSENPADNKLDLQYGNYASISDNKLSGNYFRFDYIESSTARIVFNSNTMRVWDKNADGKLVLTNSTNSLTHCQNTFDEDKTSYYLNSNISYMPVAEGSAAEYTVMTEEEYQSGIETVTVDDVTSRYYSIDGCPLATPQHGLNIVKDSNGNSRKVMVK